MQSYCSESRRMSELLGLEVRTFCGAAGAELNVVGMDQVCGATCAKGGFVVAWNNKEGV